MNIQENALLAVFSFYIDTNQKAGCPDMFSAPAFCMKGAMSE
ncbi:hypothetical protein ACFO8Q_22450 [Effusibacillus consociatus]|uniref:Uncharacterized protein n=1 Tax=Effusibacillus consociatus TaxID=1117041 RepID=A0ABV9Q7W5_9BACL